MSSGQLIKKEIHLDAPASVVWEALTNPDIVRQYLVGAKVISDWKVGSKIVYCGSFDEIDFRDEGEITIFEPDKRFQYSYWSENHGTVNVKANHVILTYSLSEASAGTLLSVSQENYQSKEIADAMNHVWDLILGKLKEVVEKQ